MIENNFISATDLDSENQNQFSLTSSSSDCYILQEDDLAIQRLISLNKDSNPYSQNFLSKIKLPQDCMILTVGCGIGILETWMAKKLCPSGHITAIDSSENFVNFARGRASSLGIENITFICKDIYEIDWSDQFDFVHCRFFLEHLESPKEAISKILRSLKDQATFLIEDDELSANYTDPPHPGYQDTLALAKRVANILGVDYDIGRSLQMLIKEQDAVILKSHAHDCEMITPEQRLTFEQTLKESSLNLITKGIISQKEIDKLLQGLKEMREGDYKIFEKFHQVYAQKIMR
ncbi:MAG: class I SAM-dependent methyltransferase [Janthinobacterium lividum]